MYVCKFWMHVNLLLFCLSAWLSNTHIDAHTHTHRHTHTLPGVGDQVGLELGQVHVEGAVEPQRGCDGGHDLPDQPGR